MNNMQQEPSRPKSMRHKRILDVAADDPDASIGDLARAVPSATPDLVERVLNEYGDPADNGGEPSMTDGDEGETTTADGGETTTADTETEPTAGSGDVSDQFAGATVTDESADDTAGASGVVDPASFTPAERETLWAIQANPEATQRTLADELGVSAATVSQRVNGIEGFEWSDRESFVDRVFDTDPTAPMTSSDDTETTDQSVAETLQALDAKLERLTEQRATQTPFEDPELIAKVVHACLDAETISTEEELEIIEALVD